MTANQSDLNDFAEKYNQIQICTILDAFTENKYVCIRFLLAISFNIRLKIPNLMIFFLLFQSSNEFPYPDKVCEQCLNDLKTAYEFKRRCEIACEQLIKLNEVSNGLGEQNNEPQSYLDNEKPIFIEQTYGCSVEIIENEPLENVAISKFEVKTKNFTHFRFGLSISFTTFAILNELIFLFNSNSKRKSIMLKMSRSKPRQVAINVTIVIEHLLEKHIFNDTWPYTQKSNRTPANTVKNRFHGMNTFVVIF